MEIEKASPANTSEKLTKLADVPPGSVFRLPDESLEQVVGNLESGGLRMVFKGTPQETGRVHYVSVDGALAGKMDADRMVIVHPATLVVSEAERV